MRAHPSDSGEIFLITILVTRSTIGKVYQGWHALGEHLAAHSAPYAASLVEKHADRWAYGHVPFFAAAYMLDPEYIDHDLTSNEEVTEGFMDTLEKIAILIEVRRLQELDGRFTDNWKARADLIARDKLAQKTWESYPTYPVTQRTGALRISARQHIASLLSTGRKKVQWHATGYWRRLKRCLPISGGTSTVLVSLSSGR